MQPPIRTTLCGHNFCEACLINSSRGRPNWKCPECRRLHECPVEFYARNCLIEKLVGKISANNSNDLISGRRQSEFGLIKLFYNEIVGSNRSSPSLRQFLWDFNLIILEIWISINATIRSRNSWSGEYTLYSILKNKYPTWKRNNIILAYNDPLPDWVFTTEDSYLRHKERQSFVSTFYIRTPGMDIKYPNF